jgi:flagellar L-ring protein precursor FlgH
MKHLVLLLIFLSSIAAFTEDKHGRQAHSLENYLARVRSSAAPAHIDRTPGSLWIDFGALSEPVSDPRARSVGDVVTIDIIELTSAESDASINTQRKFQASSGISALPGKMNTSGVQSLFSPDSAQTLQGQGKAASSSKLQTTLAGRVVAVLPSGVLVVEAERDVLMNNQRNRIVLRGIARPSDISAANVIVSTRLSNLEVELVGKGVVSDGTRQPNVLLRWLLRLVNF